MSSKQTTIALKRVYEPASISDGFRVLVDRLWPRGLRRDSVSIDMHATELAPTPALRRWFGHDPERFEEFRGLYNEELDEKTAAADALLGEAKGGRITLLFAARDLKHNHAIVLRDFLAERLEADGREKAKAGARAGH